MDFGGMPVPDTSDPARNFKGHPQPPVNERLQSIKIFLADEDPDRCLDFGSQLREIVEYLNHIEEKKVDYDKGLFHDADVMARYHLDWLDQRAKGAAELDACAAIPARISTRLIDAATTQAIEEERKLQGIEAQMRPDEPPFTLLETDQENLFMKQMREDATVDYEYIDDKDDDENLVVLENKGYVEALNDPALIPRLMNPIYGLPKTGLRKGDPKYFASRARKEGKSRRMRPPRGIYVPPYLIERDARVQELLQIDELSQSQESELSYLQFSPESKDVKHLLLAWMEAEESPETKAVEKMEKKVAYQNALFASFDDFQEKIHEEQRYATETTPSMSVELELALVELVKETAIGTAAENQGKLVVDIDQYREMFDNFLEEYMLWTSQVSTTAAEEERVVARAAQREIDFTGVAERRGIQRASIELALRLLATNQEQHRPNDRFRILELPAPYQSPAPEVPITLSLAPEKRPVEQDPFKFSKLLSRFRQWKDKDYNLARIRAANMNPARLVAPINYNGPFLAATGENIVEAVRQRQSLLNEYYLLLSNAESKTPRPLLRLMLLKASQALTSEMQVSELEPLSQEDLDLIGELCRPSWDILAQDWSDDLFQGNEPHILRFKEFVRDVEVEMTNLPWWQNPNDLKPWDNRKRGMMDVDTACRLPPYKQEQRSESAVPVSELLQSIRNTRLEDANKIRKGAVPHLWTMDEAMEYLEIMKIHHRIHFDNHNGQEPQVARIPFYGHPENKYVTKVENAALIPETRTPEGTAVKEVQYDANGGYGPPIVQPNRNEHFLYLATRLGQEIRSCLLAQDKEEWNRIDCARIQWQSISDAVNEMGIVTDDERKELGVNSIVSEFELDDLAKELNNWAPDLAQEAGFDLSPDTYPTKGTDQEKTDWSIMREQQVAALLQMQALEESRNNWELRYPEKEHFWEFAADRIDPVVDVVNGREVESKPEIPQFFSMKRWPLGCQTPEGKNMIQASGPEIQEKPEQIIESRKSMTQDTEGPHRRPVRHIRNGRPDFPFGETSMQEAFLSHRMERDLAHVPEFQPKKKPMGWLFSNEPDIPIVDTRKLPEIPKQWTPDSVSIVEKRSALLQFAKTTVGFPNPRVLEYYHTPAEIDNIRRRNQYRKEQKQRAADELARQQIVAANAAVEKYIGKSIHKLTAEERRIAREALKIDQVSGKFLSDLPKPTTAANEDMRQDKKPSKSAPRKGSLKSININNDLSDDSDDNSGGGDGPAKNTRSKSPIKKTTAKRQADNALAGEKKTKKRKATGIAELRRQRELRRARET